MSRAYPPAAFDPPQPVDGYVGVLWFRVFHCGTCRRMIGRQRIGPTYGLDERGHGPVAVGHTIERVELWWELIALPPTPEGLQSFGLPKRAFSEPPGPAGVPRRPALRRATSVLPSVETTDQFGLTQRGDPVYVGRHDPHRARASDHELVLALSGPGALAPFVVTCPNRACRRRWLVGGLPSEAELAPR